MPREKNRVIGSVGFRLGGFMHHPGGLRVCLRKISDYRRVFPMTIALGSDHAGFRYKERIKELIQKLNHRFEDFGTHSEEPVDYPIMIRPVALAVAEGRFDRGIIFGGSGNGEAMVANKVRFIRCALCWNAETAKLSRLHNDSNVLSMGQRVISEKVALEIARIWLETPFEGGRHIRRIELIEPPLPE